MQSKDKMGWDVYVHLNVRDITKLYNIHKVNKVTVIHVPLLLTSWMPYKFLREKKHHKIFSNWLFVTHVHIVNYRYIYIFFTHNYF